MKKLNRKGFMMAEVIIVSTIILTTLVGLYSIFNKMYIVYNERSYYYNVDATYALRSIYKNIINNNQMVNLINNELQEKNYTELIKNSTCNNENEYINKDICKKIQATYGITTVLFAKYNENIFTDTNKNLITDSDYNNSMKNYFDFLKNSLDFSDEENKFSYIFLIELKDKEYLYYGNYRIR